jgi:hypothetical protein
LDNTTFVYNPRRDAKLLGTNPRIIASMPMPPTRTRPRTYRNDPEDAQYDHERRGLLSDHVPSETPYQTLASLGAAADDDHDYDYDSSSPSTPLPTYSDCGDSPPHYRRLDGFFSSWSQALVMRWGSLARVMPHEATWHNVEQQRFYICAACHTGAGVHRYNCYPHPSRQPRARSTRLQSYGTMFNDDRAEVLGRGSRLRFLIPTSDLYDYADDGMCIWGWWLCLFLFLLMLLVGMIVLCVLIHDDV